MGYSYLGWFDVEHTRQTEDFMVSVWIKLMDFTAVRLHFPEALYQLRDKNIDNLPEFQLKPINHHSVQCKSISSDAS